MAASACLPRDYDALPTILGPGEVHRYVEELLDFARRNGTWGQEVAEALHDLIATRLSDTYSVLAPDLSDRVFDEVEANWSTDSMDYVDALCSVLVNITADTTPFFQQRLEIEQDERVKAILEECRDLAAAGAQEILELRARLGHQVPPFDHQASWPPGPYPRSGRIPQSPA